jgi:hypothetical protein
VDAVRSGNVEMITWVMQQPSVVCTADAMAVAAAQGHTAVCELLRAAGCPWGASACACAAEGNHVGTLRWLHEHGCPWDSTVLAAAAEVGCVAVLQYVLEQCAHISAELLTHLLSFAGARNQLAAAQWLRQQGAAWPDVLRQRRFGAWTGDTLTWARTEGCTSPTDF